MMTTVSKKQAYALVHMKIDGKTVAVSPTATVAAVLASQPDKGTRISVVLHEARAPFCGMGVCQECRVMINGKRRLACQTLCTEGMYVDTEHLMKEKQ